MKHRNSFMKRFLSLSTTAALALSLAMGASAAVDGSVIYVAGSDNGTTYQTYALDGTAATETIGTVDGVAATGEALNGFYTATVDGDKVNLTSTGSTRFTDYKEGTPFFLKDTILYDVNNAGELEYGVVYKTPVADGKIFDVIGGGVDTVEELKFNEKTALSADIYFDADGVATVFVDEAFTRPSIGISWKKDAIGNDYIGFQEAFNRNGAVATFMPKSTSLEDAKEILTHYDGLFFTGGEDVNPDFYDEQQTPHGSSWWNTTRDISDITLIQTAIDMDLPLLGVCRGEQIFNVAMGGGLIQDIPYYLGQEVAAGRIDESRVTGTWADTGYWKYDYDAGSFNKVTCPSDDLHARVQIDGLIHSGGTAYHAIGDEETIGIEGSKWMADIAEGSTINLVATAHHQAVNPEKLGEGLTIVAHSTDGIVEGIEYQDNLFALGIQFHPERDALGDSRKYPTGYMLDGVDVGGQPVDVNQDICNAYLHALVEYGAIYSDRLVASTAVVADSSDLASDASVFSVTLPGAQNLKLVSFTLDVDGDLPYEITAGADFTVHEMADGVYTAVYREGTDETIFSATDVVAATITVTSASGATVTISDVIAANSVDEVAVALTEEEATATTETYFTLDVNGDNMINWSDVSFVSEYYGHDVDDTPVNCDMNGDGEITSADYLVIYENM